MAWEGQLWKMCSVKHGENPGNLEEAGQDRTSIVYGWEREQDKKDLRSSGHTWGPILWPRAWLCSTPPLQ